jgi:lipopolysaccharide heptosyltransferase II
VYKKILLINTFGIGDVLFTTPIIHALKDAFNGVKIGYLCNARTAEILRNNPFIGAVFVYERDEFEALRRVSTFAWLKKVFALIASVKRERYELAFDFSLNSQFGFFSGFCGIKERVGYDYKKRGRFLTKKFNLESYSGRHIVDYYADLLKFAGLELKRRNLELYLKEEDRENVAGALARQGITEADFLVGVIPGAGRSWGKDAPLKHWPAQNFAGLADKIVENYNAKIIIMGDFSEAPIAKAMIANMRNQALDFTGKTTLGELAALLARMNLVVANDGGPLHMAVALGVKTVSVFGPVDDRVYGPYPADNLRHIVLKKDLACRPCYRNFRLEKCLNNRQCLEGITVDRAYSAAASLLAGKNS